MVMATAFTESDRFPKRCLLQIKRYLYINSVAQVLEKKKQNR